MSCNCAVCRDLVGVSTPLHPGVRQLREMRQQGVWDATDYDE